MSVSNPTTGLSFTQTRKVFQALAFAAHKHRDQRRKDAGASPYINHPIALADVVAEVTDDKSLDKAERKLLQIEHAAHASPRAKLVKLADKTCNLRDIATTPPADWSDQRRREYFEWAKKVVAGVRGTNAALEAAFDKALSAIK